MDLSLLCTHDQTRSPASLTDSQTGDLDSIPLLHGPRGNTLSAYETGTQTMPDLPLQADESTETLTNVSACLSHEKSADSDRFKLSSPGYNVSHCFPLCSQPVPTDNDLRVHSYFGSSEPMLTLLPHLTHNLTSPPSETFSEFYVKQQPALSVPLIQDNTAPGAMSSISEGLMEMSTAEPLTRLSFSSEHGRATYPLGSSSPHSDSSESDKAEAPMSDLYIFETETRDFLLNPNVDPHEMKCPDCQPLSQIEEKEVQHYCNTDALRCDSADTLTKSRHSSSEEQATVDYESDVGQHAGPRPPAAHACEASSMSVNDERRPTAEVSGLTPKARQSHSPVELWLDACQYLAGEDTIAMDVLDGTSRSVTQQGPSVTGDLSLPPGETRESGCHSEGREGIGWSCEDTRGWGPPVERWSSVDSWASALSDWSGIFTASPGDITTAFTEIGAEIDALTQALAGVNTDTNTETSQERQSRKTAALGMISQLNLKAACLFFGGTESSPDPHFLNTHTLTNSHVPGVDTQPGLHANVHTHVLPDTLPDLDGSCQVEPQWASPKFIMPLAPLSTSSSLLCWTGRSLERDQVCAKRSLNDNRGLKESTIDSAEKSSPEGQLDLHTGNTSECFLPERKSIIEEINDLSRELSNLADVPADHFVISEKKRPAKPIAAAVPSEKFELNQKTTEKMPHKPNKHRSESKPRSKKDKSAGHHHGAQVSIKQENLSHHVSKNPPAGLEDNQAKLRTETDVAAEKAPSKPHGKKKKKHGQNATALKNVGEPLVDEEHAAKPKSAKGRLDVFEARLGAKAEKAQKDSALSDGAEKKPQQLEAKASQGERPAHYPEHKDHQPKTFARPLNDDVIKRRRLSEDKFGKILRALESKLPKPDVCTKARAEEPKADAGASHKKPYSEVVKQKVPPKEDPKVVQPIQAASVSGEPQSLSLWCQFAAVFYDHTATWSREGTRLAEIKRSAGDESRVSLTISEASHKDLGKYQCRLSSSRASVTLDYLLTYEGQHIVFYPAAPVSVGSDEEDVRCSRLMFKEDFLSHQYFGENHPVSIITEKVHFGEGMHRRAFRTLLQAGQMPLLLPGHTCVLKVHNSISYGTKNNDELIEKNFTLAVEECQVQNTAREYIKAYTAAARSAEAFGDVPEIIPIYLVHRPSNDIPYATLEEELIGDFVKYSVKDGKEINLLRRDSEAGQKCCSFQHWVYHSTEGNLLVTDMQGVGMRLTDVGIATCKKGYKGFKGNCSTSFIDQFKALHQCNTYCEILGLKSLQPKAKKATSAPKPKPQPPAAPKKKNFGPTVKGKS
uniref:non-specific serine/threonine protein kinase n=1 Tax=Scophthalmus maximus TaxID=52904 RepID=A0A8D2ZZK4_SCOMX